MKPIKKMLFVALVAIFAATESNAQIIVNLRPRAPRAIVTPAPRRGYVWIGEEWVPRGRRYVYHGGYWMRERRGREWIPGFWDQRGRGYYWVPGHWR